MLLQPFANGPGTDATDTPDSQTSIPYSPLFNVGLHFASCFCVLQYLDTVNNIEWRGK